MNRLASIFAAFALPVLLSIPGKAQDSIKPKPGIELHSLTRFVGDARLFPDKPISYNFDLPNMVTTLKIGDHWKIISGLKMDNAESQHFADKLDTRLLFLKTRWNKNDWEAKAGLLTPDEVFGNYPVVLEKTLPLPSMDDQPLRGGITGAFVQKTMKFPAGTNFVIGQGVGWKIAAINKSFGAENGPGYNAAPSFFGRVFVQQKLSQNTMLEGGYHHLLLAKGSSGSALKEHYVYLKAAGKYGTMRLIFMAEALNSNGKTTAWIYGQMINKLLPKTDLRCAAGLHNGARTDLQILQGFGKKFQASLGAGYNFRTREAVASVGISHSF
jgi:hypothetical protein